MGLDLSGNVVEMAIYTDLNTRDLGPCKKKVKRLMASSGMHTIAVYQTLSVPSPLSLDSSRLLSTLVFASHILRGPISSTSRRIWPIFPAICLERLQFLPLPTTLIIAYLVATKKYPALL